MASLQELQQALARRLTGAVSAQSPTPNAPASKDLLADFDEGELSQSRETLLRKRLSQIASLLPKTHRALGLRYQALCRQFIEAHHYDGYQAPQLDAIHFARWLKKQPAVAAWQQELAAWEALHLQWLISSWLCRINRFHYRFNAAFDPAIYGESEPTPAKTIVVSIRLGRWGWLRFY